MVNIECTVMNLFSKLLLKQNFDSLLIPKIRFPLLLLYYIVPRPSDYNSTTHLINKLIKILLPLSRVYLVNIFVFVRSFYLFICDQSSDVLLIAVLHHYYYCHYHPNVIEFRQLLHVLPTLPL
jgi:hypothetical protein